MASVPDASLLGAAALCVGELLQVFGLTTPAWVTADYYEIGQETRGLFEVCVDSICASYDPDGQTRQVIAALALGMMAGSVAAGAALIGVILKMLSKKVHKLFSIVVLSASLSALIPIICGMGIFFDRIYNDQTVTLGYSFWLCVAGGVLTPAGGILFSVGRIHIKQGYSTIIQVMPLYQLSTNLKLNGSSSASQESYFIHTADNACDTTRKV